MKKTLSIEIPKSLSINVHGTFRVAYQFSTATGKSRFAVRNARLSAGGHILPAVDWFLQTDFCDQGRIKLLDVYLSATPLNGLKLMVGQMRVPFSVSATRQPHLYYFNDNELTALFGNLRSVGVKTGYTVPKTALYFEGGIFNATDMADHSKWNSALTYSIKANIKAGAFRPEIGFMSRVPGGKGAGVRVNQADASLSWRCGSFYAETEYILRSYAGDDFRRSQAWSVFVDYEWIVKYKWANSLSIQARFDGITDASNGIFNASGTLDANMPARRRITVGTTAKYTYGKVHFDMRFNFEQYFYSHNVYNISPADNSKLSAGLVLYF